MCITNCEWAKSNMIQAHGNEGEKMYIMEIVVGLRSSSLCFSKESILGARIFWKWKHIHLLHFDVFLTVRSTSFVCIFIILTHFQNRERNKFFGFFRPNKCGFVKMHTHRVLISCVNWFYCLKIEKIGTQRKLIDT